MKTLANQHTDTEKLALLICWALSPREDGLFATRDKELLESLHADYDAAIIAACRDMATVDRELLAMVKTAALDAITAYVEKTR